jgi:signal peptidase I
MLFFSNPHKKTRKAASEQLHLAQKVYDYRWDVMSEEDAAALRNVIKRMRHLLKDKTTPVEGLRILQDEMEPIMRRTGGHMYPKHWIADNAEMLLFAAILAIGFRTFFFQPFKIPTNSMYPSYNGMTGEVYTETAEAPNLMEQAFRFVSLGSRHYSLEAPQSGELAIGRDYKVVPGRKWFVIPTQKVRYTFYAGDTPMVVDLPLQFDIRQVFDPLLDGVSPRLSYLRDGTKVIKTGKQVKKGDVAIAFDLLTGDQLFVDRITYHFRRPKVGEPIVFRTDNLENIDRENKGKYYIKRCVGGPGDTLQIDPPGLMINGHPADAAPAFEKNRLQEGEYPGYVFAGSTSNYPLPFFKGDKPMTIPEGHYFAMGDNSPNSSDGRMWGLVPQREIVGRAVVIYYPFSFRWGMAE